MARKDLIKEIEAKDLPVEVIEKALAGIKKMADKDYAKKINYHSDKTDIRSAFHWSATDEGLEFWSEVYNARNT